ncbi:hypothetical protein NFI96_003602 [Prochilodus magdalenae]|nr:hypothetical protein NFI96_003602 [Prochilodus magdalenae]
MPEKTKYNLVDDTLEPRTPVDNDDFQYGITFEVKVSGSDACMPIYGEDSTGPPQDHHRAGSMWVVDHSQYCSDADVLV